MERRRFLRTGGLLTAGAVMSCIGRSLTPAAANAGVRGVRTAMHRVRWAGEGRLRIVQLTDFHVGVATPDAVLEDAVMATRYAAPDIVVLTGDYVNHGLSRLAQVKSLLARLPRPCVATLGNHDHWAGAAEVARTLRALDIEVLGNASTTIVARGTRLCVAGVDDGYTSHHDIGRALAGVREPGRTVVLSHYPELAGELAARGARLILSGHTHGAQLQVPIATRIATRIARMHYISGWYRVGGSSLYVSPGLGSSLLPFRTGRGTAPEIAVLDLVPAEVNA